ncbi:hypothetical protein [Massilia sp. CF038]|uniref:hypothetical protein n=1 Tax=Massilia sp. CF038 TaxID=1881045 RepID=UPI0009144DA4|nr:hypothetical protein [Massilia sp. CF038]SHH55332.1 hypothetical protein SAMN05428948_4428 [Massilia sp. CF038]
MNLRFLRPTAMLALAIGLSACGGSNTFTINVSFKDVLYDGLILVDTISGTELKVAPGTTTATFPNSLDYGKEYNVIIKDTNGVKSLPAHQTCVLGGGADTAGRLSKIQVVVECKIVSPTVTGAIKPTGVATGLQITNGTRPVFTAVAASTAYAFQFVDYGSSFGPVITAQPAGLTCTFVPPANNSVKMGPNNLSYTGTMGDVDVVVDINCVP